MEKVDNLNEELEAFLINLGYIESDNTARSVYKELARCESDKSYERVVTTHVCIDLVDLTYHVQDIVKNKPIEYEKNIGYCEKYNEIISYLVYVLTGTVVISYSALEDASSLDAMYDGYYAYYNITGGFEDEISTVKISMKELLESCGKYEMYGHNKLNTSDLVWVYLSEVIRRVKDKKQL